MATLTSPSPTITIREKRGTFSKTFNWDYFLHDNITSSKALMSWVILLGLVTFFVAAVGALRLPMPAVFPESNPKVKIGPPDAFALGSKTHLAELGLWVSRDPDGGMYAISSVCTHLGCIAQQQKNGQFLCPCHGSVFAGDGKVIAGPAPGPLSWIEMSVAPDGQVVVDKMRTVRSGERLMV